MRQGADFLKANGYKYDFKAQVWNHVDIQQ